MIRIYVPQVPEFAPVIDEARRVGVSRITDTGKGYTILESEGEIRLNRKAMKMKPAVWYGLFTGGLRGKIAEFGREEVRIIETNL